MPISGNGLKVADVSASDEDAAEAFAEGEDSICEIDEATQNMILNSTIGVENIGSQEP